MTSLALVLPCLAFLFFGYVLFRGAPLWWNMLSELWGSPLPFATRLTGWVAFAALSVGLAATCLLMAKLFLLILH